MAGVLDDDDLSLDDALVYTDALVKAEAEHKAKKRCTEGAQSLGAENFEAQPTRCPSDGVHGDFIPAPLRDYLVDIEDVGLQLDRKAARRRNGLYVTDFSASEWCQQQVAFSLSAKIPKHLTETEAMRGGTERHAILEAETAGVAVEVTIETREDAFALRLLNMEAGLQQLMTTSLTRELPICGMLHGCWVSGVIDQLAVTDDGCVRLSEQKTRFQPSLPSESQKRTTAVQVMIYWHLFKNLKQTLSLKHSEALLLVLNLRPDQPLSAAIVQHAFSGQEETPTVLTVLQRLQHTLECLPRCDPASHVNYIWQGDGELLEQELVVFDPQHLEDAAHRHLQFWMGKTPPSKVPKDELWKCKSCTFTAKCWPTHRKAVPWQH